MPTGYTAQILDGKITTFKEFAKLCMRAFGATIHMRDESLECEYEPRIPSDYHLKALKYCQEELKFLSEMSDDEIIEKKRSEILNDIEYHNKKIVESENNYQKLNTILLDVRMWEPPTEDHKGIKKFMEEQITETLKYDADSKYHIIRIRELTEELKNIEISDIKYNRLEKLQKDIKYHIKNYDEEIKRVKDSNKWVEKLLNSI